MKGIGEIIENCNPGWALLGSFLYLMQMYVTAKFVSKMVVGGAAVLIAACVGAAPICLYFGLVLMGGLFKKANDLLVETKEVIVGGCETLPGGN